MSYETNPFRSKRAGNRWIQGGRSMRARGLAGDPNLSDCSTGGIAGMTSSSACNDDAGNVTTYGAYQAKSGGGSSSSSSGGGGNASAAAGSFFGALTASIMGAGKKPVPVVSSGVSPTMMIAALGVGGLALYMLLKK
jgi:hypothetical protein